KRRRGGREIEKLLGEYRASGLGRQEFAAVHRISRATLIRWLRREKERTANLEQEREAGVGLVEVTLAGNGSPGGTASPGWEGRDVGYDYALEWPGSGRLQVRRGFDGGEVQRLIGWLRGQPRP
ncbi:MAG TPA: hypothetical protein VIT91_11840, partial [Chthoniobacterales bacterium]